MQSIDSCCQNIQSTNWQTVRFKPPPNGSIGWRVEFRVIEAQLTDFANAAYATFIALLSRVIVKNRLDFYIPISKVDENMEIAKKRNAAADGRFFFRNNLSPSQGDTSYRPMSSDEILNGVVGGFIGLIPLVSEFLPSMALDTATLHRVNEYLRYLSLRASGMSKLASLRNSSHLIASHRICYSLSLTSASACNSTDCW
jgi:glutamate--cysteine ligase catalytic subunit